MNATFLPTHADLFTWHDTPIAVEPWEPEALNHEQWPPDYRAVYAWRLRQLAVLENNPVMLASAMTYYSTRPTEFIMHWMDTYNPRKKTDKWMPFVFFMKQVEVIQLLEELTRDGESGLIEKCRDAGVTWLACGYSVHSWLFVDNDAIGWGSRKEGLVDKLGDPDSIFEKMRLILRRLPLCFLPAGFDEKKHATFMRMINPQNGSIIAGEAGDNIGRGGRKRIYFKDESAHYPRPDLIEAALGNNTDIQVDISSVNGLGNVFHRRRVAGVNWQPNAEKKIAPGFTRVLVIDWKDHPEKTQEWYDQGRAKHEREGLLHLWAQEVDRNYSAAIQNAIISGEWVTAAIDAHLKLGEPSEWLGEFSAALDVGDEGLDRNALVKREGLILRHANEWGERDPGVSTRNVLGDLKEHLGIKIQYDCIGIGVSVRSEFNRLVEDKTIDPNMIEMVPWNAGAGVVEPAYHIIPDDIKSPMNGDFFGNMKAQAWWSLRTRFYKTWRAVTQGAKYPVDELISIDSKIAYLHQISDELTQPTIGRSVKTLKMIINKKPDGTRSPNIADAIVMAYFPVPSHYGIAAQGVYGNV